MKEIKLEIRIHSLQYDELTPQDRELIDKAKEARKSIASLGADGDGIHTVHDAGYEMLHVTVSLPARGRFESVLIPYRFAW